MDGNGRWAKKRFRNRVYGHEAGIDSVKAVIKCCLEWGIPYLTLYAFSKENWKRPSSEIQALWQLMKRFLHAELPVLVEHGVRVVHIGDREGLPEDICRLLDEAVEKTACGSSLYLQVALNYGGRQEIVRAVRLIAEKVKSGVLDPSAISVETINTHLFTGEVPDPDLLIRTSGEFRVSNFLLWQIAYTEIYITDVLWPDFREREFLKAVEDYQRRERRFGMTSEQVEAREIAHLS
ncbi:Undecaprenyl pyrophosphate synthetase [Thermodesulforhabdus norvegica]|uniref:Isoprenyl transferase n=2 Tax=Thermodesulforhabdus norvegica TaxID=39841 RepID=A0A1I4QMG7_9BACT|nr:Undecaprenyl pyrophosphate synthetase [Thermodesulforhabdus norvegica]